MKTEGAPLDAMILGDSHAIALKAGCDLLGLNTAMLSLSGNFWHAKLIGLHQSRGLVAKGGAQGRVRSVKAKYGLDTIPQPGLPIIASFGFHLGRILPMFGADGHRTAAAEFLADAQTLFVSNALMSDYVDSFRRYHITLLRRIARQVPTVLVAPPWLTNDGNAQAFAAEILSRMQAGGLTTVDPCTALFGQGGTLPEALREADGNHGTAEYGAQVITHLLNQGLFPGRG